VLAKSASAISVLDLIEGVDGPMTEIWVRPESRGQRNGNRRTTINRSVQAFAASFAAGADTLGEVSQSGANEPGRRRDLAHAFGNGRSSSDDMPQQRQAKTSARAFGHLTTAARAFLESLKVSDLAGTSLRPHDVRATDILEVNVTPGEWASGNWVI
jgi:hypothetical protein